MKKIQIKILSLVMLISMLSSCKKWVDYNPHDEFKITDLDYLKSESDYRTMAVSVYTPLQWINQIVPVGEIATDNAVAGGEAASDVPDLQQIDDYNHTPLNFTMADIWQSAYEGVNRANYLYQYKEANKAGDKIDFAGKDALYGEVSFLRAYFYFTLVKTFGDVPLFIDKRLALTDSKTKQRAPKADVYKQIEADLNSAITALPAIQSQKGRITKYAAQALLGKVYLYQNKFQQAADMLELVIKSNAFYLVGGPMDPTHNFADIFLHAGENGPESVFEIQYANTSPYWDWGATTKGQGNFSIQQCGIRSINSTSDSMPYAPGWSTNLPTQNLAAAYTPGDQRKEATLMDIEKYKADHPTWNITFQVAPYKNTGLYNQKFLPRKGENTTIDKGQPELNYLNNFRTIRYADVLLMAAEANSKMGVTAKAQDYLNQVRRRAFKDDLHTINSAGDALTKAIWDERRLELAMEGDRFFDLVRTGQAAAKITGFVIGKHEVFPIPQAEIDISGLTQNPNY